MTKRKRYTAEFKKKVALEALKDNKTNNELASKFLVNPVQISVWKKKAKEGMTETFTAVQQKRKPRAKMKSLRRYTRKLDG